MFEFLQTLTPTQIAGGVLAGSLILGLHPPQVRNNLLRRKNTADVDHQSTRVGPSQTVVYFNEQYQSETSSDSEIEALPAVEHIGDAVGRLEGEDNPEASMKAMAGSIERL
ncbi:hypothetical protein J6590_104399 [Homalodisca vitripennis]|nr:hypothetical protein J6590_104399 [Homalodisca vitripennis]